MDLLEIHALYLEGTPVEAPWEDDPSFEVVLQMHEFDYVWRRIELPLDVVGLKIDLSLEPNPGREEADEAERFEWIREWGRENGSLSAALVKRPPSVIVDDTQAVMIDGRHRLALASLEGMTTVPVIVGMPEGYEPAQGIEFPCYVMPPALAPFRSPSI